MTKTEERVKLHLRVDNDFTYHAPSEDDIKVHRTVRDLALDYARYMIDHVPIGRELSLALTKLEEVVFWANAGIARNKEDVNELLT